MEILIDWPSYTLIHPRKNITNTFYTGAPGWCIICMLYFEVIGKTYSGQQRGGKLSRKFKLLGTDGGGPSNSISLRGSKFGSADAHENCWRIKWQNLFADRCFCRGTWLYLSYQLPKSVRYSLARTNSHQHFLTRHYFFNVFPSNSMYSQSHKVSQEIRNSRTYQKWFIYWGNWLTSIFSLIF